MATTHEQNAQNILEPTNAEEQNVTQQKEEVSLKTNASKDGDVKEKEEEEPAAKEGKKEVDVLKVEHIEEGEKEGIDAIDKDHIQEGKDADDNATEKIVVNPTGKTSELANKQKGTEKYDDVFKPVKQITDAQLEKTKAKEEDKAPRTAAATTKEIDLIKSEILKEEAEEKVVNIKVEMQGNVEKLSTKTDAVYAANVQKQYHQQQEPPQPLQSEKIIGTANSITQQQQQQPQIISASITQNFYAQEQPQYHQEQLQQWPKIQAALYERQQQQPQQQQQSTKYCEQEHELEKTKAKEEDKAPRTAAATTKEIDLIKSEILKEEAEEKVVNIKVEMQGNVEELSTQTDAVYAANVPQKQYHQQQEPPQPLQSEKIIGTANSITQQQQQQPQIISGPITQNFYAQEQPQYHQEQLQQWPKIQAALYERQQQQPQQQQQSTKYCEQEHEVTQNVAKHVDLHKIFTPANDAKYISPMNRKLYSSSAFYSPSLHPTVQDQVELARRISHSLSDISNQKSRGQSMYVNRKKRSVKWVHEGQGQDIKSHEYELEEEENTIDEETKENNNKTYANKKKIPLKWLMNPRGQIHDIYSLKDPINTKTGLLSPEKCAELVSALTEHKGKGAELFAKRRKKSEKWIVDATHSTRTSNTTSTQCLDDNIADYQQLDSRIPNKLASSPNLLPAYSDVGKHRVQLNLHQEKLLQKYVKPDLCVVKTPWEAALESGSASTAFVETPLTNHTPILHTALTPRRSLSPIQPVQQQQQQPQLKRQPVNDPLLDNINKYQLSKVSPHAQLKPCSNYQRDLAYKPNVPQGWKSSCVYLPSDLYVPPEIPLKSYGPPPPMPTALNNVILASPTLPSATNSAPSNNTLTISSVEAPPSTWTSKPAPPLHRETFPIYQPPKQQYFPPDSYRKVTSAFSPQLPGITFTPSPLPHEKLAKFQLADESAASWPAKPQSSCYAVLEPQKLTSTSPIMACNINYQRALSNPRGTLRYVRYDAPNYNNFARGWCKGTVASSLSSTRCLYNAASPSPNSIYNSSLLFSDF